MTALHHPALQFTERIARFVHERNPAEVLVLYSVIRNTLATLIARKHKQLPDYVRNQFLVFSLFPLLFGAVGTVQSLGAAIGGFVQFFANPNKIPNVETYFHKVTIQVVTDFAHALDGLFWGLLGSLYSFCLFLQFLPHLNITRSTNPESESSPS